MKILCFILRRYGASFPLTTFYWYERLTYSHTHVDKTNVLWCWGMKRIEEPSVPTSNEGLENLCEDTRRDCADPVLPNKKEAGLELPDLLGDLARVVEAQWALQGMLLIIDSRMRLRRITNLY